jgi:hypothetical protein
VGLGLDELGKGVDRAQQFVKLTRQGEIQCVAYA